jgi:energy-coupling factor transporter ATP-binding protein EcfA2
LCASKELVRYLKQAYNDEDCKKRINTVFQNPDNNEIEETEDDDQAVIREKTSMRFLVAARKARLDRMFDTKKLEEEASELLPTKRPRAG